MLLEGKVAIVTGAGSGIGRASAQLFADEGAKVAAIDLNADALNRVVSEIETAGKPVKGWTLDLADGEAIKTVFAEIADHFGGVDILVNNAGIERSGPVLDLSQEDWDAVIGTNLTGSFLCAKHAGQAMVSAGSGGKMINIGSIYSVYGTPEFANYGASKAGVLGLTRALAIELAPHNIQVNAILPGWYETEMTKDSAGTSRGEDIRRKTPAGRWGTVEDLVGASIFLASAASSFVTGVGLPVDGGYLISERLGDD